MSPLQANRLRRGGSLAAALTLSALSLVACGPDAARDPLAPAASTASADARGDAAPASGQQQALPFRGTVEATETHTHVGEVTALIHGTGTGIATHLGRFALEFDLVGDLATGASETNLSLTAANGDVLTAAGGGHAALSEDFLSLIVVESFTITGGNGRFADATGSFVLERVIDLTRGSPYPSSGSFTGSITLARPLAGR